MPEKISGLDIIEKHGLAKYSVLVSSRFDDLQIRNRCEALGVKGIPKGLAGFVPIRVMGR